MKKASIILLLIATLFSCNKSEKDKVFPKEPIVVAFGFVLNHFDVVQDTIKDGDNSLGFSTLSITITGSNDAPILTGDLTAERNVNSRATTRSDHLFDEIQDRRGRPRVEVRDPLVAAVMATGAFMGQLADFDVAAFIG